MMNKTISFEISKKQEEVLRKLAQSNDKSISEFIMYTVYEKIADETDIEIFNARKDAEDRNQEFSKDLNTVIEEFSI